MDFRANPLCGGALRQLTAEGVSPWLAGTGRESLATGLLARLVAESGIRGASSDVAGMIPAVAGSPYYADQLTALGASGASAAQAVSALLAEDARRACDELRDVFEQSQYRDGFVSVVTHVVSPPSQTVRTGNASPSGRARLRDGTAR